MQPGGEADLPSHGQGPGRPPSGKAMPACLFGISICSADCGPKASQPSMAAEHQQIWRAICWASSLAHVRIMPWQVSDQFCVAAQSPTALHFCSCCAAPPSLYTFCFEEQPLGASRVRRTSCATSASFRRPVALTHRQCALCRAAATGAFSRRLLLARPRCTCS